MGRKKQARPAGCMYLILAGMLSVILLVYVRGFLGFPMLLAIPLAIGVSVYFSNELLGRPDKRVFRQGLIILTVFIGLISLGIRVINSELRTNRYQSDNFEGLEGVNRSTLEENGGTVPVFASNRVWRDNYGSSYQARLMVREYDYQMLKDYLNSYTPGQKTNFWGRLYHYMEQQDGPKLDLLMQAFREIGQSRNLSAMDFAEMVVSCIQDIPYSLVFQDECLPAYMYERSIREILEDCPECCLGEQPFGIQNPVSFMSNLKGDCDTRTVMIYSILKGFDYDVAILNSDFYRHSIIGLNIPASGKQITFNGKRYYVWETTARYFKIGQLPYSVDDMNYWNVVLTSK
ncbi:hypothetical protein [Aureitalea marina]|uniref:Uncharacterized protein n=1 Tax=Aureitalea marina TaxID=930804 RepID=A0A2S7KTI3_9FLAO|nr:hypothetical protein [Aureitalea marina]PQB05833.1 hypothetical protein BST85_13695 [Aureitalea marina]